MRVLLRAWSRRGGRWLAPLLAAVLAGCASPGEWQARETLRRIERGEFGPLPSLRGPKPALPQLTEASPLADYVRYAELSNPGVQAALSKWRAALERVAQVATLPEPRLTLMGMWTRGRSEPIEKRAEGSQEFMGFGKLTAMGEMALAEAEMARQEHEMARLRVAYRVKDAYFELYYVARAVAVMRENVELLKNFEAIALSRYRVGKGEFMDTVRAQVELSKVENELRSLTDMLGPIGAQLNAALGRGPAAPLPPPKAIPEEKLEDAEEALVARLRECSPELRMLAAEIAKERAAVALARRSYYPDFMLGLRYTVESPPDAMGMRSWMPMVTSALPVWWGKYRAARREAEARLEGASLAQADKSNTLSSDLAMMLFRYRDAARRVALYRDSLIPKADQSLKAVQAAYAVGRAEFTALVDAERMLLEFRLDQERARTDQAQRLAEIEMMIGGRGPAARPSPSK